jgi:glucuronosyltransferase
MIAIPFLADQGANAEKIVRMKIGSHIELFSLTEEKLRNMILEVLKPEYKKNVEKLRDLIQDEPMTPREKAVWWVEYVIRHNGTKHLDYIGRHVPFYQKYFLDFIGIAFVILILIIFIVRLTVKKILSVIKPQEKIKSKKL